MICTVCQHFLVVLLCAATEELGSVLAGIWRGRWRPVYRSPSSPVCGRVVRPERFRPKIKSLSLSRLGRDRGRIMPNIIL